MLNFLLFVVIVCIWLEVLFCFGVLNVLILSIGKINNMLVKNVCVVVFVVGVIVGVVGLFLFSKIVWLCFFVNVISLDFRNWIFVFLILWFLLKKYMF